MWEQRATKNVPDMAEKAGLSVEGLFLSLNG
jgi:hypothetical protein